MTVIRNTEKKFLKDEAGNTVLNPYWYCLLTQDDRYVDGFLDAIEETKPIVENVSDEIDDSSETIAKIKKDIAEDVAEEILLNLDFLRNQMIVMAIDALPKKEWSKRCQEILDTLPEEEKNLNPIHPDKAEGKLIGEWD